jgi:uncharacterized protein YdcH (DUF465 family)
MNGLSASDRTANLKRQHEDLARKVARLERRSFLTPEERQTVTDLKKRKLRAKDELFLVKAQR